MIRNLSKNTILSENFSYKNGLGKTKGLLFNDKSEAIVFKTRFGIHTFFMKYPIDLIILNRQKEVVFLKEAVRPNRMLFWNPKFDLVLELPKGSIKKSKTQLSDCLSLNL